MSGSVSAVESHRHFPGQGETAGLFRSTDWSVLPTGPAESWPKHILAAVNLMIDSSVPMVVAWGPDFRLLYNDPCLPLLGTRHPKSFGKPAFESLPDAWDRLEPLLHASRKGKAIHHHDLYLPSYKNGNIEDCYLTFSLSPLRDPSGSIDATFAVIEDTTARVEERRRLSTLLELSRHTAGARSLEQACRDAMDVFARNPIDVPFALVYLLQQPTGPARLTALSGVGAGTSAAPPMVDINGHVEDRWPIRDALASHEPLILNNVDSRFDGTLIGAAYHEPVRSALLSPVTPPGAGKPCGVLITGVNPRRPLDAAYLGFFQEAVEHMSRTIMNAQAYDAIHRRAEMLIHERAAETGRFRSAALNLMEDALEARRRAERDAEALQRSEQHLELISNTLPTLISYIGRDLRYGSCNQAYLRWFGLSSEEVIDKPVVDVLGEKVWSVVHPHLQAALSGETVDFETEAEYLHGGTRWIHAVYTPHRDSGGEVIGLVVMVTDITARKRAEETFREGEERFRAIVNQATAGVSRADFSGRFTFVNPRYCEIVGYTEAELLGMRMQDLTHPDDLPANLEQFHRLVREDTDFVVEKRYIRKDGSVIWVNNSVSAIHDAAGRPQGALAVTLDMSERKRQEAELARRSRHQSLLFELAEAVNRADELADLYRKALDVITLSLNTDRGSILLFDDDGVMRFKAWRGLSAAYRRKVEGHSPWTRDERDPKPVILGNIAEAGLDPSLGAVIQQEGIHAVGFFPLTYGGRLIGKFMVYFGRPYLMTEEETNLAQVIASTLANGIERKMAEDRLREHQRQLQALADQLEQLVDERTHELVQSRDQLRDLATELNLAEQRERRRMASELHDYLAQLLVLAKMKLGQGKRLSESVPACVDILRESEEALTEALTYTRTLVADLSPPVLHDFGLPAALHWLGQQMERHQLKVSVRLAPDVHPKLPNDQALLVFQSVRELLMNIAKHSGSGDAVLSLGQDNGFLRIEVHDDGKGFTVSPENITSTKFGLFSIRERMRALGGALEIESAPGMGTTAVLTLPIAVDGKTEVLPSDACPLSDHMARRSAADALQSGHQSPRSSDRDIGRMRVLLVDDHVMVRQGLCSMLGDYPDIEVLGEASNGDEAVVLTERLRPSIVLMDINMPKMNGIQATALIKSRHPDIIVIGLSVQASHESHLAMLKAGAARLLSKEAAADQLYQAMQHALTGHDRRPC
jgi:PAS domain S-box-containing protein